MRGSLRVLLGTVLCLAFLAGPVVSSALACGGGGGDDSENALANIGNRSPQSGIETGTADIGLPLPSWDELKRADLEKQQEEDYWSNWWWGWASAICTTGEYSAIVANFVGQAAQLGLNFVPGLAVVNIGLDAARGGAEGYATGLESGLSQTESVKVGGQNAVATGLFSAFTNKLGFGKNYSKAVGKVQKAVKPAQIVKAKKSLAKGILGTTADQATQEVVGDINAKNIAKNTSPKAALRK